jgi:predicted MarR family transcription regulator
MVMGNKPSCAVFQREVACKLGCNFRIEYVKKLAVNDAEAKFPKRDARRAKVPAHLAATEHEKIVTDFEQSLICAAEAFYRFAGALLGPEANEHNLSGHDCVILQQLVTARSPRRIGELLRFANRDDVSNVQYSLRKLIKAGLVEQVKGTRQRDVVYVVTASGGRASARLVAQRRELLMKPAAQFGDHAEEQMRALSMTLGLLTGIYDHGTRVLIARNLEARAFK